MPLISGLVRHQRRSKSNRIGHDSTNSSRPRRLFRHRSQVSTLRLTTARGAPSGRTRPCGVAGATLDCGDERFSPRFESQRRRFPYATQQTNVTASGSAGQLSYADIQPLGMSRGLPRVSVGFEDAASSRSPPTRPGPSGAVGWRQRAPFGRPLELVVMSSTEKFRDETKRPAVHDHGSRCVCPAQPPHT